MAKHVLAGLQREKREKVCVCGISTSEGSPSNHIGLEWGCCSPLGLSALEYIVLSRVTQKRRCKKF